VTDLSRGRNNPNSSPYLALAKAQDVCPRNTLVGGGCDLRCDNQDDYRCADVGLSQQLCWQSMDVLSISFASHAGGTKASDWVCSCKLCSCSMGQRCSARLAAHVRDFADNGSRATCEAVAPCISLA
jgi:hypothetical protein